jgi:SAM-dependent methyltransferase
MQGSASPDNVGSLVSFFARQGIFAPRIHVLDLIDLQALGYADPRAVYHRANAADLSTLFDDGSFDCVVQDHLLNCAPIAMYRPILSEAARILRPGGAAFLHYTDSSGFPQAKGHALSRYLLETATAYSLHLPADVRELFAEKPVEERLMAVGEGHILATLPFGNLEHFLPFPRFAEQLDAAGLLLETHNRLNIVDGEGLDCRRNHCLASPRPR